MRTVLRSAAGGATGSGVQWSVVVPERRGVITANTVQRDAIYFIECQGGAIWLLRMARGSAEPSLVALPQVGTVRLQPGQPGTDGALVSVESWAIPPVWYVVAADGKTVRKRDIDPGMGAAPATGVISTSLEARSQDGTMVPVSIT